MKFQDKFTKFITAIKKYGISRSEFNEVLEWGQVYGYLLYANKSGLYRDDDFEKRLLSLYFKNQKTIYELPIKNRELHIISTPYAYGGHTRLLEKIISFRQCGDILITRPFKRKSNMLRYKKCTKVFYKNSYFEFEELVKIISNYNLIFLYIHPDDLKAAVAAAVAKEKGARIIFINHADHCFSYGFYKADIVAEVSSFGMAINKKYRKANSSYLGIPLDFKDIGKVDFKKNNKNMKFIAGASSGKLKPTKQLSFPRLVNQILSVHSSAQFTIVGPNLLTDWWWWWPKIRHRGRLRIVRSIPHCNYIKLLKLHDLYFDSLPMTGGTALPEARALGVPVTGVLCGSSGYTPLDYLKFQDISVLVENFSKDTQKGYEKILARNNDLQILRSMKFAHHAEHVSYRLKYMIEKNMLFNSFNLADSICIDYYKNIWLDEKVININLRSFIFILKKSCKKEFLSLLTVFSFFSFSQLVKFLSFAIKKIVYVR